MASEAADVRRMFQAVEMVRTGDIESFQAACDLVGSQAALGILADAMVSALPQDPRLREVEKALNETSLATVLSHLEERDEHAAAAAG